MAFPSVSIPCPSPGSYLDVGELADVAMAPPEMWLPAMDVVDNGFFS
jgi:hypothetical protein